MAWFSHRIQLYYVRKWSPPFALVLFFLLCISRCRFFFFSFFGLIRFVYTSNFHWPYHNYHYYRAVPPHSSTRHSRVLADRLTGVLPNCRNYNYCEFYGIWSMLWSFCFFFFFLVHAAGHSWGRSRRSNTQILTRNDETRAFIYSGKFCHYYNLFLAAMCLCVRMNGCCLRCGVARVCAHLIELEPAGNISNVNVCYSMTFTWN